MPIRTRSMKSTMLASALILVGLADNCSAEVLLLNSYLGSQREIDQYIGEAANSYYWDMSAKPARAILPLRANIEVDEIQDLHAAPVLAQIELAASVLKRVDRLTDLAGVSRCAAASPDNDCKKIQLYVGFARVSGDLIALPRFPAASYLSEVRWPTMQAAKTFISLAGELYSLECEVQAQASNTTSNATIVGRVVLLKAPTIIKAQENPAAIDMCVAHILHVPWVQVTNANKLEPAFAASVATIRRVEDLLGRDKEGSQDYLTILQTLRRALSVQ